MFEAFITVCGLTLGGTVVDECITPDPRTGFATEQQCQDWVVTAVPNFIGMLQVRGHPGVFVTDVGCRPMSSGT